MEESEGGHNDVPDKTKEPSLTRREMVLLIATLAGATLACGSGATIPAGESKEVSTEGEDYGTSETPSSTPAPGVTPTGTPEYDQGLTIGEEATKEAQRNAEAHKISELVSEVIEEYDWQYGVNVELNGVYGFPEGAVENVLPIYVFEQRPLMFIDLEGNLFVFNKLPYMLDTISLKTLVAYAVALSSVKTITRHTTTDGEIIDMFGFTKVVERPEHQTFYINRAMAHTLAHNLSGFYGTRYISSLSQLYSPAHQIEIMSQIDLGQKFAGLMTKTGDHMEAMPEVARYYSGSNLSGMITQITGVGVHSGQIDLIHNMFEKVSQGLETPDGAIWRIMQGLELIDPDAYPGGTTTQTGTDKEFYRFYRSFKNPNVLARALEGRLRRQSRA